MIKFILSGGLIILVMMGGGNREPALAFYCAAIAIAFLIWLNRGIVKKNSLNMPLAALLMVCAFSLINSGGINNFIFAGVLAATVALIYIFSSISDDKFFNIFSAILIILCSTLGGLISFLAIFQKNFYTPTMFMPFPNINLVSGFILTGMVTAISLLFHNKDSKILEFPLNRRILAVCILIMFLGMLFSFSRGAWIGLFAAIFIVLFFRTKNIFKTTIILLAFFAVLTAIIILLPKLYSENRLSQKIFTPGSSTHLIIWKTSINAFKSKPITGWGPGNFEYAYHRFKVPFTSNFVHYEKYTRFAHNEYLNFAVEMGLPGLAAFLWLLISSAKSSYKRIIKSFSENTGDTWKYIACLAVITAASFHAFFDFNLHFPAILFVFSFFAGFSAKSDDKASIDEKIVFVLRPACLIIIIAAVSATLSYAFTQRADFLSSGGDNKNAANNYKIAVALNPSIASVWNKLAYISEDSEQKEIIRNAIFFNPSDSFLHQELGRIFVKHLQLMPAFFEYLRAIELNPKNPFFYCEVAEMFFKHGWLDDSLYYFKKAYRVEPYFAFAHLRAGQILLIKKDKINAITEFKTALRSEKLFKSDANNAYTKMLVSIDYNILRMKLKEFKK